MVYFFVQREMLTNLVYSTMSGKPEKQFSRRDILKASVTIPAAAAIMPGAAEAHILDVLLGRESKEQLEDKMHAAHTYMAYNNGELKRNLGRLQLEVGDKMRSGEYDKFGKPGEREQAQKKDGAPIFEERDKILEIFDETLISKLLVTYVERGIEDKSLVVLYQQLGGDIGDIKKFGDTGVDKGIVDRVMSKITYSLGSGPQNYGIADYNVLTFEEKPRSSETAHK